MKNKQLQRRNAGSFESVVDDGTVNHFAQDDKFYWDEGLR
jgi:hypothetical protein